MRRFRKLAGYLSPTEEEKAAKLRRDTPSSSTIRGLATGRQLLKELMEFATQPRSMRRTTVYDVVG